MLPELQPGDVMAFLGIERARPLIREETEDRVRVVGRPIKTSYNDWE